MAEVYYGTDVQLQRPVAVKVFDLQSRGNAAQSKRFMQEARMMAQWRHNHIVQIYYAGSATGLFYYVMEYVDGYDLASIMAVYAEKKELMPFEDVLRIGDAVASALDYAHKSGVIHRDVKPANVMIAKDGKVVLGDFGLALSVSDKSVGEVFGSPHYISPEQARRSSDAVPQSDLYSLGVILYEMLTGATPFNDPSPASLALQHITEPPPLPRSINPALSVEIENVLIKALEKNPVDRYQSGAQLMEALRDAITAKPAPTVVNTPSSMPPIPVGVPTVQRSDISLNSFTKRGDVLAELERHTSSRHRIKAVDPAHPKRVRANRVIVPALLLLALLGLGWFYYPNLTSLLNDRPIVTVVTEVNTDTATPLEQVPVQLENSATASPKPTTTSSSTPTRKPTATLTTTATSTNTSTPTQSETLIPTFTITSTNGIKYPDGYLMTAYYNPSSFYILDRGSASRSVSGFSFDRVNSDGTFLNGFLGWQWQKYFNVIQPNYCISIEIYPTTIPYLKPEECDKRVLSNIRLAPTDAQLFWTTSENSNEFRVLWLNEEIARCEIGVGTCDFRIP